MMIRISDENLTVMKKSFSESEKASFDGVAAGLPSYLAVFEHDYTWTICGTKERLFETLVSLSKQFDIEIV